jgi:hypothetical protein
MLANNSVPGCVFKSPVVAIAAAENKVSFMMMGRVDPGARDESLAIDRSPR